MRSGLLPITVSNAHRQENQNGRIGPTSQLTLRIWHPDCWTLQTTAEVDAGLVAHRVYNHETRVTARLTAYGDSIDDVNRLIDKIESSEFTDATKQIDSYFDPNLRSRAAGNATQELLVEYEPQYSIHDAVLSRGLVPEDRIRIRDGHEYWTVITSKSRATVQQCLDSIRDEQDAEIDILGMKSNKTGATSEDSFSHLSQRQREVFELARREGYYTWPREVTAGELADDLDISKTTLLEHLRKAEAKLLGPE